MNSPVFLFLRFENGLLVQGKGILHFQRPEQLLHDVVCNGADVQGQHGGDDGLDFLLGHLEDAQIGPKEPFQLALQSEIDVTGVGHVRAHDPGGADFHLIEVAAGGLGQIGRENLLELCGGVLMDQIQQIRLGVDLYIDLPQILVQFYQGQLDAGLHGIEHHRACILADDLSGNAELVGEHEADELFQNVAFGLVQVVKGAGADICLLKDLLGRGIAEALLQEELHTGGQDTLLRSLPVITGTNGDRLLSVVFRIYSNIPDSS